MKVLLATRKGLIIYKYKKSWELEKSHFDGVNVTYVNVDENTNQIWAGLKHGHWGPKLHQSSNSGKSFQEISIPKFPEGKISLKGFWAFSSDSKGRLYLGTEPAELFHSDDEGKTWELNQSLHMIHGKDKWFPGASEAPCLHSILINPQNISNILLGVSVGGVIETQDRGKSWRYRAKGLNATFMPDPETEIGQDPHLIYRAKSNSSIIWQQNHCGIFKSINGGESWIDLSKSKGVKASFGWAVVCDPKNENIAYTVPALSDETRIPFQKKLFVQKTTNGGKSWSVLNKGLPQKNCYDIVYRHSLDLHENHLVFGTTTGHVYFSKNEGKTWARIPEFLPPIYALKIIV